MTRFTCDAALYDIRLPVAIAPDWTRAEVDDVRISEFEPIVFVSSGTSLVNETELVLTPMRATGTALLLTWQGGKLFFYQTLDHAVNIYETVHIPAQRQASSES